MPEFALQVVHTFSCHCALPRGSFSVHEPAQSSLTHDETRQDVAKSYGSAGSVSGFSETIGADSKGTHLTLLRIFVHSFLSSSNNRTEQ